MIWRYSHFRKPPYYMFYFLSHTLTLLFFEHEQITATRQSKFTLHANPPCGKMAPTSLLKSFCDKSTHSNCRGRAWRVWRGIFFQSVWILTSAGWISLLLLQIILLFLKSHQKDRKGAPFPNIPLVRSQLCSFNSKLLPLQTVVVSGEKKLIFTGKTNIFHFPMLFGWFCGSKFNFCWHFPMVFPWFCGSILPSLQRSPRPAALPTAAARQWHWARWSGNGPELSPTFGGDG